MKLARAYLSAGLTALLLAAAALPVQAHDGLRHGGNRDRAERHEHGAYVPPAPETLGGRFEMLDHRGRTVTDRSFEGRWLLLFFGYAACREACPIALETMAEALERLGEHARMVQPLFVDVSLEEPDLVGLGEFVGNFHPAMVGLTGNRKQIFDIARIFKVRREYMHANYSSRETGPRIDHATNMYLVDPSGVTRAYFYHDVTGKDLARIIRHHAAGAGAGR